MCGLLAVVEGAGVSPNGNPWHLAELMPTVNTGIRDAVT
jgi:hypothetical protein